MRFTTAARQALESITDQDRIAEVGNYAKHLALADGRQLVIKADVLSATLAAGPEFLPPHPTAPVAGEGE